MKNTLTIPGTSDRLDLEAFTARIHTAPPSEAREYMLAVLQADAAEGTNAHLTALLASPLKKDANGKISLTLPASTASLQAQRTTGLRPAGFYQSPRISRRQFAIGAAYAGGAAALATSIVPTAAPDSTPAEAAQGETIAGVLSQSPASSPTNIPWPAVAAGTSVAAVGYVISRMIPKEPTLGRETSRRSLLGEGYAQAPLDSTHAADNLLNIMNSFLSKHEQGISR